MNFIDCELWAYCVQGIVCVEWVADGYTVPTKILFQLFFFFYSSSSSKSAISLRSWLLSFSSSFYCWALRCCCCLQPHKTGHFSWSENRLLYLTALSAIVLISAQQKKKSKCLSLVFFMYFISLNIVSWIFQYRKVDYNFFEFQNICIGLSSIKWICLSVLTKSSKS